MPVKPFKGLDLTIEGFRKWLHSHRPNQWVGLKRRSQFCPLTCYVSKNGGPPNAETHVNCISTIDIDFGTIETIELQYWAQRFISLIDMHKGEPDITANVALMYLRKVEQELKDEVTIDRNQV